MFYQNDAQNELCIPVVQIERESYRMRAHRARVETMRRSLTTPLPDVLRRAQSGSLPDADGVAASQKEVLRPKS
ncbi:MAG: hypothetical protein ACYDA0_15585 [Candidatus Dormibacteraceae bacterium]